MWRKLQKAPHIFRRRLRTQGLPGALLWASAPSVDTFTGIPSISLSGHAPHHSTSTDRHGRDALLCIQLT